MSVRLAGDTSWRPEAGAVQLGGQQAVEAALVEGSYRFEVPAQIETGWLRVRISDFRKDVRVDPVTRPELSSLVARVTLPEYLGRPEAISRDVRGGGISLVLGSRVSFVATATRELSAAAVDSQGVAPEGAQFTSPPVEVVETRDVEFEWTDGFGLTGREPFALSVAGRRDEPPSLDTEGLPRRRVVLDSELLSFTVLAQDDYGVKVVGMEWEGVETESLDVKEPARGERVLAGGGHDKENLELTGTFSAAKLNIQPQSLHVRIFVEDYLPGRERVYSPNYLLHVLNADEHMIWLTDQLSRWHRQSLEVRDRELRLLETNKQLRDLPAEELDLPENRRRIENQVSAERANARRLDGLVMSGEELVRQATRNPQFGVEHLETWAAMLQILKDIAGNRMPSVADLLKQAAEAPLASSAGTPVPQGPMVGNVRSAGQGTPSAGSRGGNQKLAAVPTVIDAESSQQPPQEEQSGMAPPGKASTAKLGLAKTTLQGASKPKKGGAQGGGSGPANEAMEVAVAAQEDLLAEFEKVAEELNRVLGHLEGSTLVKRLKAASRTQLKIAGRLGGEVTELFGVPAAAVAAAAEPKEELFGELAAQENTSSQKVSLIMDDMLAYFERRRLVEFRDVLDEMKAADVVGGLRQLGDELRKESALTIAQCEYWSDHLDRWAENLVGPGCQGQCSGGGSAKSLPPSIILEVLMILEEEIALREETRVAEQARPVVTEEERLGQTGKLADTQNTLRDRTDKVTQRIRELPDGEKEFGKEIALLTSVSKVMLETTEILARPETGLRAIGAETEAIELLLQTQRANPKSGGGGDFKPGGGGNGGTSTPALALLGTGRNEAEVRAPAEVSQATGDSGMTLPEEFRGGLDEYFSKLEQ
jgi:hypothetical protein